MQTRGPPGVNALAYTIGADVVFAERQYAPEATAGRRLLAHELTHVIQQGGDAPLTASNGEDCDHLEPTSGSGVEATQAKTNRVHGRTSVSVLSRHVIQRTVRPANVTCHQTGLTNPDLTGDEAVATIAAADADAIDVAREAEARLTEQLRAARAGDPVEAEFDTILQEELGLTLTTRWLGMGATTSELKVASIGRDETERFAPNDWVELIDDERELQGLPGTMMQVASATGDAVTIKPSTAIPAGTINFATFTTNPKVRRWGPGGVQRVTPCTFIDLEGGIQVRFQAGRFRTGDYWVIPARTAVGNIEWPFATPQRPFGIRHHYCLLGVVTVNASGGIAVTDCRKIFPPLTELPAGADLKKHNRYLHGWGVVCGLQVHCGGTARETVQVEKGYAIACDGTDIFVDSPQQLPIVERAAASQLIDANGNGKVCVTLAPAVAGSFALDVTKDEVTGQSFQDRVLEGTLLKDVIDDCLRPLFKELAQAFAGEDSEDPRVVAERARNQVAATNLLAQLANQSKGQRVFLSQDEHVRLVNLLKSRTFCAIQDDLPAPPQYPFNQDIAVGTLYGKGAHRGLRVSPDGTRAYAFGEASSNRVLVFDLQNGEAVAEVELPLTTPTVQDVLPLNELVVVAATNANGSTIVTLSARELKLVGDPLIVAGRQVVRLFAFGIVKGEGLVRFEPLRPTVDQFLETHAAFNATGHLSTPGPALQAPLVAGAAAAGAAADNYTQLADIQVRGRDARVGRMIPLTGLNGAAVSGDDSIEIVQSFSSPTGALLTVVQVVIRQSGADQRSLLTIDHGQGKAVAEFPLGTEGRCSMRRRRIAR